MCRTPPGSLSVNPCRGCKHGCVYCFARPTHGYLGSATGACQRCERRLGITRFDKAPARLGFDREPIGFDWTQFRTPRRDGDERQPTLF